MIELKDNIKKTEEKSKNLFNGLEFIELNRENAEKYIAIGRKCPYLLSCYSLGFLLMWSDYFNAAYAMTNGCVVVRLNIKGKEKFLYPYAVDEDADISATLDVIEKYTAKKGVPLEFHGVPRSVLPNLISRYNNLSFTFNRNESEYIYSSQEMKEFIGRKYSGQRNHINKFIKTCPGAVFRLLGENNTDHDLLERFWEKFEVGFTSDQRLAQIELHKAKEMFAASPNSTDKKACVELNGEIISVCYGEVWGDMLIVHIEKALDNCAGSYPFMVSNFAKAFSGDSKYINREDDAGSRGLRISKMQYHPIKIEDNISVEVKTELSRLTEQPSITTKNLTIDSLTEQDIKLYNRLCLDVEHNKFWGYDYREHIEGEPSYDYFYRDAIAGYENKIILTLAVRHNGKFIGEAVINEFNYRGSANLGLRLLPEYTGRGYGKEAFAAVADYAIYGLGLSNITAYCYRENAASCRMLASVMEITGEDDIYSYFIKTI